MSKKDALLTFQYLPPEAFSDVAVSYDHTVDLYSFGMLLSELFSATVPFSLYTEYLRESTEEGHVWKNKGADLKKAIHNGLRPQLPYQLNPVLSNMIEKAWHFEPSKRGSFKEIVGTLTSSFANQTLFV